MDQFANPYKRLEIENYAPKFEQDKFYCLDGGFASSLQIFHEGAVENDPLWSCRALKTDPNAVIQTHKAFLEAGADIITTNSYQAHHELFRKHISDFKDPIIDPHLLIEKSVELADEAIVEVTGRRRTIGKLLAGSVGPYGACLGDGSEYTGSYINSPMTRQMLCDWHKDRIKRLTFKDGVDIIAAETLPSYIEALAILDALKEVPGARCWISFQCNDQGCTAKGEPIEEAFRAILEHPEAIRVKAFGMNCVKASSVTPMLEKLNKVNHWRAWPNTDFFQKVPYVVYPNGGQDWDAVNKCWTGNCDDILSHVKDWMILGANVIGGCCRIGPDVIKQIKNCILQHVYDVMKIRLEQVRADKRPIDQWSFHEKKLKKPPYEEQKKRMEAAKEFFRDASEDGDANALITAQLEAMMSIENKEVYEALKTLELRQPPKEEGETEEENDELKC